MKGQFFKTYYICDELGVGGMSKVYLAFDLKTMQFVAIKFLHQNIQQDEMFVARLRREVNIYRDVDHKNVINLVEDGLEESPPYMVLEYLRGIPLDKLIKTEGRLPLGRTFQILSDVTEALHSIHRNKIIHRDLQPGNIIQTYMGWCKVFDFGIAKRDDGLYETEPGTVMGTIIYSAPEQNMGLVVNQSADMYSMGLILFEMLTGNRAMDGTSLDEIRMEQTDDLEPPSEFVQEVPEELDEICEFLTQRVADDRIENATKLLIELGKLRAGGDNSFEARIIKDPAERRLASTRTAVFEEKWEFVNNMCQRMEQKGEGGPQITFYHAKAASRLGKADLAERKYEKAIFQDKENLEFLVDYAIFLIQHEKYEKAQKVLHEVPVGGEQTANMLVAGLLQLLAAKDRWPDTSEPLPGSGRSSFIGRLFGKLRGE